MRLKTTAPIIEVTKTILHGDTLDIPLKTPAVNVILPVKAN